MYLDTDVFVYYLVQEVLRTETPTAYQRGVEAYGKASEYRRNARLAALVLDRINSSVYDGVFSALVFLELRKKLRAFLCQHTKLDMGDIEITIAKAFGVLWQVRNWYSPELQHENELDENRAQLKWHDVMTRASEIHKANIGERSSDNSTRHVGTKAIDVVHIALAEKFDCGYLVTFDKDFVTARNQFSSLSVRIVHLPYEIGILLPRKS